MREDAPAASAGQSSHTPSYRPSSLISTMRSRNSGLARSSRPSSYSESDRARSTTNASDASTPDLINDSSTTESLSNDNMSLSNSSSTMYEVQGRFLPDDETEEIEEGDLEGDLEIDMDSASGYARTTYHAQMDVESIYDPNMRNRLDSTTRSLNPLDLPYVYENDRRYCGDYWMPNDEAEQTRLHLVHQVFKRTMDGKLTTVRLEDPSHILDVGAATGEWAMDMAELYPDCDVVGMDISDIFERSAPVNCNWEVDDAELEWERPSNNYDLIHLRNMEGSFKDWDFVYESAFRCLKPGGWLEVTDFEGLRDFRGFFSYFEPDSIVHKMLHDFDKAADLAGKPLGPVHLEPKLLLNAGCTDVNLTEYTIPLRTKDGSVGKLWLVATLDCLESSTLRLLTKYMGWTADEVRLACNHVAEEILSIARSSKRGKGWHMKLKVVTGRKPVTGPDYWPSSSNEEDPSTNQQQHHHHQTNSETAFQDGSAYATHPSSLDDGIETDSRDLTPGQRSLAGDSMNVRGAASQILSNDAGTLSTQSLDQSAVSSYQTSESTSNGTPLCNNGDYNQSSSSRPSGEH